MPRCTSNSFRGFGPQDGVSLFPSIRGHVHIYQRKLSPRSIYRPQPRYCQDAHTSYACSRAGGVLGKANRRWEESWPPCKAC